MCYAFALFNFGFIVPVVTGTLASLASRRPRKTRFVPPRVWKRLFYAFNYTAVAAVAAAICLLSVTIYQLQFSQRNGDSPLRFNFAPRPAAIVTFVILGGAFVIILFALILHHAGSGGEEGLNTLLSRKEKEPGLDEYMLI